MSQEIQPTAPPLRLPAYIVQVIVEPNHRMLDRIVGRYGASAYPRFKGVLLPSYDGSDLYFLVIQ